MVQPRLRNELALELHDAAETDEAFSVGRAVARVEHADAVDDGCDCRACAATEVVAVRADAQVVVAARSHGSGTSRSSPAADFTITVSPDARRSPNTRFVDAEFAEHAADATDVLRVQRRRDVEPVRDLGAAMDDPREAADHDVADPLAVERREERVRIKRRLLAHRRRSSSSRRAWTRCCRACRTLPLELGVERGRQRTLGNHDLQLKAAGLDGRAEIREARLLTTDLPACNLRAFTAEPGQRAQSESSPP